MSNANALDAFLGHRTRSEGIKRFGRWKKRERPIARIVLMKTAPIVPNWVCPVPEVREREKDGRTVREVWTIDQKSFEPESVLLDQYFRDSDGTRKNPPTICPISILAETVRTMVATGDLDITQPVFRWEGDDPSKAREIVAGALYGGFKKPSPQVEAKMKAAGIKASKVWADSFMAKCKYVFVLVDYDNPDDGVQVATETSLLGEKMKRCIHDRREREGHDEGNPLKNPVVFQWKFNANSRDIQDTYHVIDKPNLEIPDEILEMIEQPAPSLGQTLALPNLTKLRNNLESHCLVDDIPWDDIFAAAESLYAKEDAEDEEESDDIDEIKSRAKKAFTAPNKPALDDEGDDEEEEEAAPPKVAKKRPARRVEPEELDEDEDEAPVVKKRAAKKVAAKKSVKKTTDKKAKRSLDEDFPDDGDDDDLPW